MAGLYKKFGTAAHQTAFVLRGPRAEGPPLVKAASRLNYFLHHDWESPIFEHLFASLGEHRTLYRDSRSRQRLIG